MADLVAPELRPWTVGATLFSAFGALGLLVAVVGLYSVLAYDVAQRRREIGVRLALGARPGDVLRLVVRRGVDREFVWLHFVVQGVGDVGT